MCPDPIISPSLVREAFNFASEVDYATHNEKAAIVRQVIHKLHPSAYYTIQAILDHLTRLLIKEPEETYGNLATELASIIIGDEDMRFRLFCHFMLKSKTSIFTFDRFQIQKKRLSDLSWARIHNLDEEAQHSKPRQEIERQVLLHEFFILASQCWQKLDTLQQVYKDPVLDSLMHSSQHQHRVRGFFDSEVGIRDAFKWLTDQFRKRQREQIPWIASIGDLLFPWITKSRHLYLFMIANFAYVRYCIAIVSKGEPRHPMYCEPVGSDRSLQGETFTECFYQPITAIHALTNLLTAIYDNMQDVAQWRLLQYTETSAQDEHGNLGHAIEELEPVTSELWKIFRLDMPRLSIDTLGFKGDTATLDRLDILNPARTFLYNARIQMSRKNTLKVETVEAVLLDNCLVLAHRGWERDRDDRDPAFKLTMTCEVKFTVSSRHQSVVLRTTNNSHSPFLVIEICVS